MNEKRRWFYHLYTDKMDQEKKILELFGDDIEIIDVNESTFELDMVEYLMAMTNETYDKYTKVRKIMLA